MAKGWIEPEKYNEICGLIPIVSVDVAVFRGDNLLLLKRQMPPIVGTWCLPGGGIRLGENPYMTASRELEEETGIKVVGNFVYADGVVTYLFGYKQNIGIGMVTQLIDCPSIKMDGEHDDYGWFNIFDLPEQIDEQMLAQIKNCICAYHEKGWLLDD